MVVWTWTCEGKKRFCHTAHLLVVEETPDELRWAWKERHGAARVLCGISRETAVAKGVSTSAGCRVLFWARQAEWTGLLVQRQGDSAVLRRDGRTGKRRRRHLTGRASPEHFIIC